MTRVLPLSSSQKRRRRGYEWRKAGRLGTRDLAGPVRGCRGACAVKQAGKCLCEVDLIKAPRETGQIAEN